MVKMRIGRIFFFLSILFFMGSDSVGSVETTRRVVSTGGLTPITENADLGKAFLERREGFLILHLEGSPYEMGFQEGVLLKEEIAEVYKEYLYKKVIDEWVGVYALMKKSKLARRSPREVLLENAKQLEKAIPLKYLEQMRGLAEGAGVSSDDVLMLTTHVDFLVALCSGFATWGSLTEGGGLITGRNLDWGRGEEGLFEKYTTIRICSPKEGFPFVSISYPGFSGVLTGMNTQGLTLEVNFSMCEDNDSSGLPITILLQKALSNSPDIKTAVKTITSAKRTGGFNILLTSAKDNQAKVVEVSAHQYGIREAIDERIITTNHFLTPELKGKNSRLSTLFSSTSEDRYGRLVELIEENKGKINLKKACQFMHDFEVRQKGTIQSIVFLPESLDFFVWAGHLPFGNFVKFNLKEELL